jgi:hypothetical protein
VVFHSCQHVHSGTTISNWWETRFSFGGKAWRSGIGRPDADFSISARLPRNPAFDGHNQLIYPIQWPCADGCFDRSGMERYYTGNNHRRGTNLAVQQDRQTLNQKCIDFFSLKEMQWLRG